MNPDETIELLQRLDQLFYIENGTLMWKNRDDDKGWSRQFANKAAGSILKGHRTSYRQLGMTINGHKFNILAHRIAFALHGGHWPTMTIDHIDHNGLNNDPPNLRDVSQEENNKNRRLYKKSKSGFSGVRLRRGKWVATIGRGLGVSTHIGQYDTKEEAVAARKEQEVILGYNNTASINKEPNNAEL